MGKFNYETPTTKVTHKHTPDGVTGSHCASWKDALKPSCTPPLCSQSQSTVSPQPWPDQIKAIGLGPRSPPGRASICQGCVNHPQINDQIIMPQSMDIWSSGHLVTGLCVHQDGHRASMSYFLSKHSTGTACEVGRLSRSRACNIVINEFSSLPGPGHRDRGTALGAARDSYIPQPPLSINTEGGPHGQYRLPSGGHTLLSLLSPGPHLSSWAT